MLNVNYGGDNNYEGTGFQEILVVNQTRTYLSVNISDVKCGDDLIVYAGLVDENNEKITADIILNIDRSYKIIITNGTGFRNLGNVVKLIFHFNSLFLNY